MAQHWTSAQIQTALSTTLGNLYPYQIKAIHDALSRVPHTESPDGEAVADAGSAGGESTIATIFPSGGLNP
jgi:hypothetical protein